MTHRLALNTSVDLVLTSAGAEQYNRACEAKNIPQSLWERAVAGTKVNMMLWNIGNYFVITAGSEPPFENGDILLDGADVRPGRFFEARWLSTGTASKFLAVDKEDAKRRVEAYLRGQNKGEAKSDRLYVRSLRELTMEEYDASNGVTYLVK